VSVLRGAIEERSPLRSNNPKSSVSISSSSSLASSNLR
jgi:hypothetical protein